MGIEKNVEDCLVLRINQFVPKRVVFDTKTKYSTSRLGHYQETENLAKPKFFQLRCFAFCVAFAFRVYCRNDYLEARRMVDGTKHDGLRAC